jgi:apolipoprotein N-acyltransferase
MLKDLFLACLSAVLLILSFPDLDFSVLSWIGMVPLFLAVAGKGVLYGFLVSYLSGGIFFLGIFSWIFEVSGYTFLHHLLLDVYLGVFFGIFGLAFNLISRRVGLAAAFWAAPFVWVCLEFLRSHLSFLALPWGLLSHSQHQNTLIIQFASFTGSYSISFLIVLVNAALALFLKNFLERKGDKLITDHISLAWRNSVTMLLVATALTGAALLYGYFALAEPANGQAIKLSVVQGNIPQIEKWNRKFRKQIVKTYIDLTDKASKDHPLLIVWPETAVPLSIIRNPKLYGDLIHLAHKTNAYLLVGSAESQKFKKKETKHPKYWNSAFLINPYPRLDKQQRYDKIRLMPFGEYLPAKDTIPWANVQVPNVVGYLPGKEFTIFEISGVKFGATICWENIFPDLVQQFVKNGAQFIVNITNEAWFGKTAAPYQFLSMSVLRAVENKVPVVRCANTGVSCFIDQNGRIIERVRDNQNNDVFVQGVLTREIFISGSQTFYTKHGDIFVYFCFFVTLLFLALTFLKIHTKRSNNRVIRIKEDYKRTFP